ncbi:tyrosine-protein phosphatase [bacterium]
MIDIHTHLLPNIDDGPRDWKEAMALLKQGADDGIRGAVCTSHVLNRLDEKIEQRLLAAFQEFKIKAKQEGIEMSLWLGSEIHCQSIFEYTNKVATINGNKKYLLFELPLGDFPSDTNERIFQLNLDKVTLILAHPERNIYIMNHPETAFEMVNRGVLMQMNAGSITGVFGKRVKRVAEILMKHHLVHFVGSDCHNVYSRPMILSEAFHLIHKNYGAETAKNLFHRYPALAIKGDPIHAAPSMSPEKRKKRWILF